MKHTLTILPALLLAPLAALHAGELRLGAVFSDHMVLQRDKPVPVWGLADRSEQITVEFAGQKETTIAGMDGKWLVKLNPMAASAEPRTLWVRSGHQDRKVQVADVLVGDVWLAAGQSNMAMSVAKSGENAIATREPLPSGIRFFGAGAWQRITTAEVPKQSAVAWAFAREIAQAQKLPMGIIVVAKGGTRIEAWMPRSALMRTEAGRSFAALAEQPEVIAAAAEDARAFVPYPQTKLYTWRMGRALPATLHAEFIAPSVPFPCAECSGIRASPMPAAWRTRRLMRSTCRFWCSLGETSWSSQLCTSLSSSFRTTNNRRQKAAPGLGFNFANRSNRP
jgi:sialate O-acetylesterase